MGDRTEIEWADKTYNPWIGCTKISPACANCYAEHFARRRGIKWGPGEARVRTKTERDVRRWNRSAGELIGAGWPREKVTSRVFVASLADWLDPEVPVSWLTDLLYLIAECEHLDFLLLTKRPELWRERLTRALIFADPNEENPERWAWLDEWLCGTPPANVWVGISAEDQIHLDWRWRHLRAIPALVRFLSVEPMLGRIALPSCALGEVCQCDDCVALGLSEGEKLHWVIAGGESGAKARPTNPAWFRSLRDQCQVAGVPFFFKQHGEWVGSLTLDGETATGGDLDGSVVRGPRTPFYEWGGGVVSVRVGKKAAGRLLDGREWSEVPRGQ